MSTICGWFGPTLESSQVNSTLCAMLGVESTAEQNIAGFADPKSALYTLSHGEEIAYYAEDNIHAAIIGAARWRQQDTSSSRPISGVKQLISTYKKFGEKAVEHLASAFAFVILDINNQTCLCAIDRFGRESLYYAHLPGEGVVFANSIDTLIAHPYIDAELDSQALYNYVYFHVIPSPGTVYKNIYKLEPGEQLCYKQGAKQGAFDLRRYWLPTFSEIPGSFADLQKKLKEQLNFAVEQCHPDKTTGAFLSGGLDSSTVCGVLSGIQNEPSQVFTIGFDEQGYDEIPYARIAAKQYGANLTEFYVSPEHVVEAIPIIAKAYDEPFGNSSAIPAYFCARLAKENGITTLLAGDGGDELFAGNERYAKQKVFDIYNNVPQWLRTSVLEPIFTGIGITQNIPIVSKVRSYIEQARIPMPERMESYNFLRRTDPETIFNKEFFARINSQHPIEMLTKEYNRVPNDSLVNRMLYLDWKFTLADNDLRKVNKMCAINGVKVRYPMLNDELVDFSTRVPSDLKLKGNQLRYFYKQALNDFLPQEIITKSKHGFGLPFGQWLKKSPQLQALIYDNLSTLKSRNIFQASFIDQLISTHRSGHAAYYGGMLWVLAILEEWFKQHNIR